jgi:hypothetical protein
VFVNVTVRTPAVESSNVTDAARDPLDPTYVIDEAWEGVGINIKPIPNKDAAARLPRECVLIRLVPHNLTDWSLEEL